MLINPTDLLGQLNKQHPKFIFVDIFDTLVKRIVHPDNTKKLSSIKIARALGYEGYSNLLLRIRAITERQMCLVNGELHDELEFSFGEFPKNYFRNLKSVLPWLGIEEADFCQLCRDIEGQVETIVLRRDDLTCDALLTYKPQVHAIIGVSDFYLPRPFLLDLIKRAGVRDILDRLYVSCDEMRTKRSGRLYAHVLQDLGMDPTQAVMIGDNAHSDGDMAKANGIFPLVLDRTARRAHYEEVRVAIGTVRRARDVFTNYSRQKVDGTEPCQLFDELAVTLYLFVRRLHEAASCNQIDRLQFLSREGKFLRTLFEAYQNVLGISAPNAIATDYLYVSRRATFPAVLRPLEEENFETLFRQYRKLSPRMFLISLGWPEKTITTVCKTCGVDADAMEDDFPTSANFSRLLESDHFKRSYEDCRLMRQTLITNYLALAKKDRYGRLVLVDVGWKGTIQDHLRRALADDTELWGFYLGMSAPGLVKPGNRKIPLLFSYAGPLARHNQTFGAVRELFEAIMVADHGSVGSYAKQGQTIAPELDDQPDEMRVYAEHVAPLQARLLALVRAIASDPAFQALSDSSLEALAEELHNRVINSPTDAEIEWHMAQQFYENFGTLELRGLAKTASKAGLIDNVRFLINPAPYEASSGEWKAAHLHRSGLRPALTVRSWLARRANRDRIRQLEETIKELSGKVNEYALSIDRMTSLVLDREAETRGAANLAVRRFAIMQEMDAAIASRDEAIRAQEARISELQTSVATIEKLVDARDEVIRAQTHVIEDQRAKLRNPVSEPK